MSVAVTDLAGLQQIARLARTDQGAALEQVARQFESFFVSELLKGMRAANEVFGADNPMNTQEMSFRQDMLDQQLSVSLTEGKGLGIAAMFARQLRQQFGVARGADGGDDGVPGVDPVLPDRRVDRAPRATEISGRPVVPQPQLQALPVVVSNAMRVIRPLVEEARDRVADAVERFVDKESFVRALAPFARDAAARLGVDPRVLVAQAALETGWGQSILGDSTGRSSFNLFNIKAGSYWQGGSIGVTTLEFQGGVPRPQRARFRAYATFGESFADYANLLLTSDRYRGAVAAAADPARFLHALAGAGYATDPAYAFKILALLRDPALAEAQ